MLNAPALALRHAPRGWNDTFHRSQSRFIRDTVQPVQPVAGMLAKAYADTLRERDYRAANVQLREAVERLRVADFNLAMTDDELVNWCEAKAKKGSALLSRARATDQLAVIEAEVLAAQELAGRYGFELPDVDDVGPFPILARVAEAHWWRGNARRLQGREVERVAQLLRRVRKGREIYCSDVTLARFKAARVRNRRLLESLTATNEDGDSYTLAELSDRGTSNPKLRRGELMVRIRGLDMVAQECEHVREFWTFTTPPRFHPFTTTGKVIRPNPRHDGSTTGDAHEWLTTAWARIRAALDRAGVRLYGFRVVEAHHDGTPHWHAVLFYDPAWPGDAQRAAQPRVRAIVRRYLIAEERAAVAALVQPGAVLTAAIVKAGRAERAYYKAQSRAALVGPMQARKAQAKADHAQAEHLRAVVEALSVARGVEVPAEQRSRKTKHARKWLKIAKLRRTKFVEVDDSKGDAASYLAKYIAKALPTDDAADLVQHDLYGEDNAGSSERVGAWAWSNRVRQFQQIGGPGVTVWRELRRAMGDERTQLDLLDAPEIVYECANAADAADWAAFFMLMGGPTMPRKTHLLKPARWEEIDLDTGEIKGKPLTRYGEIPKARIFGLQVTATGYNILTRVHTWTVGQDTPAPVAVEGTRLIAHEVDKVLADLGRDSWAPWSYVWQLAPDYAHARNPDPGGFGFGFSGGATAPPLESCQ